MFMAMSATVLPPDEVMMNKIYFIRGRKVMLDKDLAVLYEVRPIRLREQVRRNIDRFPENFMIQLTDDESDNMVSQNAIPSKKSLGGHRPLAFTEHGVLMLANVLKSERAITVSLRLIEIFVKMREMLSAHKDILLKLEQLESQVTQNSEDIKLIFDTIKLLVSPPQTPRPRIGFKRKDEE